MANPRDDDQNARAAAGRLQIFREIIGIAGASLAGSGAWLHYPPAGLMVAGGILVGLAVVGTLRSDIA